MIFISKKLKLLRKGKDLSQKEIAEDLNFTFNQISDWETGRSLPNLEQTIKLSEYFNVSTDYLLGIEPQAPHQIQPQESQLQEDEQQLLDAYRTFTAGKKKALFDMLEIEPSKDNIKKTFKA